MSNEEKNLQKTNINWYPGHMAKTKRELKEKLNLIDIIYEVVDARMPVASKMKDMDDIITSKPHILIMTKKDLCDMSETNKWIKLYEEAGLNVVIMDLKNDNDYKVLVNITKELMEPINEKRKAKGLMEKEIRIGVVGIPNVGKSTLINKLAHKKVASVGNKPGVTKQVNWLKTPYGFLMLDTPGILWPNLGDNEESLALAATGTIRPEIINMTDIGGFLVSFYKKFYPNILKDKYNIDASIDIASIFDTLADYYKMYSNGEADYEKVSIKLYNDLISGKVSGITFDIVK